MNKRRTNRSATRKIIENVTLTSTFLALHILLTLTIVIPVPIGSGFINISDSLTLVLGLLLPPVINGFVCGLSAFICDLALGYGIYAPFSFIIKFILGLGTAFLIRKIGCIKNKIILYYFSLIFVFALGETIMTSLYFLTDIILYDMNFAYVNLFGNTIQGVTSLLIAFSFYLLIQQVVKLKTNI